MRRYTSRYSCVCSASSLVLPRTLLTRSETSLQYKVSLELPTRFIPTSKIQVVGWRTHSLNEE